MIEKDKLENTLVMGLQFGDEGKGKITNLLADRADIVVRYQGGNNAGHTIIIEDKVFKLNLLPSGILNEKKLCIIGSGVVLNPFDLLKELESIQSHNIDITPKNLLIDENTTLVLPIHKIIDGIRESTSKKSIGTTKKGIGPSYEDKIARRAVKVGDLLYPDYLKRRIQDLVAFHKPYLQEQDVEINAQDIYNELLEIADKIKPFVSKTWQVLKQARDDNKIVLFEGAQGALLDIDHGTYPFVTSSNIYSGYASIGGNFGLKDIKKILGVVKGYTTRVGNGPFPSEIVDDEEMHNHFVTVGKEYGTVTKRQRRCGWFDAVSIRKSIFVNSVTSLALTKVDVLDDLDEIKICTGYDVDGEIVQEIPHNAVSCLVKPIYITVKGWKAKTYGLTDAAKLPKELIQYIKTIQELVGVNVSLVSTGPDKSHIIYFNHSSID